MFYLDRQLVVTPTMPLNPLQLWDFFDPHKYWVGGMGVFWCNRARPCPIPGACPGALWCWEREELQRNRSPPSGAVVVAGLSHVNSATPLPEMSSAHDARAQLAGAYSPCTAHANNTHPDVKWFGWTAGSPSLACPNF